MTCLVAADKVLPFEMRCKKADAFQGIMFEHLAGRCNRTSIQSPAQRTSVDSVRTKCRNGLDFTVERRSMKWEAVRAVAPFGFGQGKNHFRGTLENKRCPTMEAPHNRRTSNRLEVSHPSE